MTMTVTHLEQDLGQRVLDVPGQSLGVLQQHVCLQGVGITVGFPGEVQANISPSLLQACAHSVKGGKQHNFMQNLKLSNTSSSKPSFTNVKNVIFVLYDPTCYVQNHY